MIIIRVNLLEGIEGSSYLVENDRVKKRSMKK